MAFVVELPSAEDIKNFNLPHWTDLEEPIEHRRTWCADRERDAYLSGVGYTGNPAFDEDIKQRTSFYLGRTRFNVILEPSESPNDFKADPYTIHYPAILKIEVYISLECGTINVLPEVRKAPDSPHPFLQNKSFNEFVALLKDALTAYKADSSNKYIHGTIIVSFGF